MSKLTGDQIREAIDGVTSGAGEKKRNLIETIELQIQIGLKNSDPQKDKRFSGSVKLPHIPKVCILRDAQEMGSDTVDLEVEKLLDSDDVMELDEMVASPRCFTSGIDREFENIDISKYHLMFKFEDKSKKRDEDEFGHEEEDVGNDEKIEEYTKRPFGNAFVASKDVFRQEKKQKRF